MNANAVRNEGFCHGAPEGVSVFRSIQRVLIVPVLPLLISGCATEADSSAEFLSSSAHGGKSGSVRTELPPGDEFDTLAKGHRGLRLGYEWTEYTIGVRRQRSHFTFPRTVSRCLASRAAISFRATERFIPDAKPSTSSVNV